MVVHAGGHLAVSLKEAYILFPAISSISVECHQVLASHESICNAELISLAGETPDFEAHQPGFGREMESASAARPVSACRAGAL